MKKLTIAVLIFAHINSYWGCYKTSVLQKPDVNTNAPELSVTTTDGRSIQFEPHMYRFLNDTIDGFGHEIIAGEKQTTSRMKLALTDISSVETKESHNKAFFFIIGTVLVMSTVAINSALAK